MGSRIGGLIAFAVVLTAGVLLGSGMVEWFGGGERRPGEVSATPDVPGVPPELGRITVEVLNAGGREGMAREATERLRELGFDVVSFGNAGAFGQAESVVLDRAGRPEAARRVARALGVETVRSEPDPNLLVDVTVRIGSEWERDGLGSAEAAGREPWWDVRRFLPDDAGD